MGNQACVSSRDPISQESSCNRAIIDIGSHKSVNSHILKDSGSFPELPTLSDEVPVSMTPQNTKIKASVARKKNKEVNSTYSIQNFHYRNQSLGSIKEQDESQDNYSSRDINCKNQPNTVRSDQTVSKTTRHFTSNSFCEYSTQTNRRHKQNIFPIAIGVKDTSSAYCQTSRNSDKNAKGPKADSFRDNREIKSTRREKRIDVYNQKDSSCTFTNTKKFQNQNLSSDNRKSDPIQLYLKKFTEANNNNNSHLNKGMHIRSSSTGNKASHAIFKSKLDCQINRDKISSLTITQDTNNDNTITKADHDEAYSPEKPVFTFQPFDSPQRRITSESTLLSEPNTNEASHFMIGAKRLSDYELVNKMASLNLRGLISDDHNGSKNLTSITEFDQLQVIEEENNGLQRKRNSLQGTLNSGRYKSNVYIQEDLKGHKSLGKIKESGNTARSDYSVASSIALTMKKDPNDVERKMSTKSYHSNHSGQDSQNQNQRVVQNMVELSLLDNRECLKEIQNTDNFLKVQKFERNFLGRISTVSECFQETEQSQDSLNRTGELSMMSPTNIESPDAVNLPLSKPQRRTPSPPNRDSLRQHVLSKALKRNKKLLQEMGNMEESAKSGFLSYGQTSNDPYESVDNDVEHTNSTCSESSMPRESTIGLAIKYSSVGTEKVECDDDFRNYSSAQKTARTPQYLLISKSNMDAYRAKIELGMLKGGKENSSEYIERNDRPYVRRFNAAVDYNRPFDIFGSKKMI